MRASAGTPQAEPPWRGQGRSSRRQRPIAPRPGEIDRVHLDLTLAGFPIRRASLRPGGASRGIQDRQHHPARRRAGRRRLVAPDQPPQPRTVPDHGLPGRADLQDIGPLDPRRPELREPHGRLPTVGRQSHMKILLAEYLSALRRLQGGRHPGGNLGRFRPEDIQSHRDRDLRPRGDDTVEGPGAQLDR